MQFCEGHEFPDVAFIESPLLRIGDIGKPFNFRGYIGERLILIRRERTFAVSSSFDTALPELWFLTR
jgi:hypothetical protein